VSSKESIAAPETSALFYCSWSQDGSMTSSRSERQNGPGGQPVEESLRQRQPYPVDDLGEILAPAARAIAERVQVPIELAAQSVLSVASLAAQAVADVRLPFGQTRPLSLFCMTIAKSGDRKTTSDYEAMAPVRLRECELRRQFEPMQDQYAVDHAAWRAQKAQIERAKDELADRKQLLKELGLGPTPPLEPVLTVGESTAEGLAKLWPAMHGALGIFSNEGGQFFGGHGFTPEAKLRTAASFAQLWDGSPLRRLRAGDGLGDLRGRRLAMHIMIQPDAAEGVLNDQVLRDQGLLSRLLIAAPETLAGTRFWKHAAETAPEIERYTQSIASIFEQPVKTAKKCGNELEPLVLQLTAGAQMVWTLFYNEVEREQGPGAIYSTLRDVAGKAAEQAARIAGVLATVDDPNTAAIDRESMWQAGGLATWYLNEALRVSIEAENAPTKKDAAELRRWLERQGMARVTATEFQQNGPNRLRRKEALDPAIEVLIRDGVLVPAGSSGRAWRVAH
jgi:hypothetical protein